MKFIYSIVLPALMLVSCKANHEHDGLYIANESITGVTKAWIVEGDVLTVYTAGISEAKEIDQLHDYIVTDDDQTYYFNSQGGIVIPSKAKGGKEIVMMKYSAKTQYKYGELDKIIDTAVPPKFKR